MLQNLSPHEFSECLIYLNTDNAPFLDLIHQSIAFHNKKLTKFFSSEPIRITVIVANSRTEFDQFVTKLLGVPIHTPSNSGRIAQPQRDQLVLLSPKAYETDSCYKYKAEEFDRLICHEMVHIFEENLSPDIELNPLWFSEGLAVWFSKQYLLDDDLYTQITEFAKNNTLPAFNDIISGKVSAYLWGWSLIETIINLFCEDFLVTLVKEKTGDSIISALPNNFDLIWFDHLIYTLRNQFE